MTPAEFRSTAKARINDYERKRDDLDVLNAKRCQIAAACAGVKGATVREFMIFMKEEPEKSQSEKGWNGSLDAWGALRKV